MSLDLYQQDVENRFNSLEPVSDVGPGAFDNFVSGSASTALQLSAKAYRSVALAASLIPIGIDKVIGGTTLTDKYFKGFDDVAVRAVDYWNAETADVGKAGQIVGGFMGSIPMVLSSPLGFVAQSQLSTTMDLANAGVPLGQSVAAGAAVGAGSGLGLYVPILGNTLTQRALLWGAGFNVAQGVVTRGAAEQILKGTTAEGQFEAFDAGEMTLDALIGLAFGTATHLVPSMRAKAELENKAFYDNLKNLKNTVKSEVKDALFVMRLAQHKSVDSMPGKPAGPNDIALHTQKMNKVVDKMMKNEPVDVEDINGGNFEFDKARADEMINRAQYIQDVANRMRIEEGLPHPDVFEIKSAKDLSPEHRAIEGRFAQRVAGDFEGITKEYAKRPDSENGKILNTDTMREVDPHYSKDRTLSAAVHEPASYAIKRLYAQKLAQPPAPGERPLVLFTAGGTGAGKTTAIQDVPTMKAFKDVSQIIYDTNMNTLESARLKVQQALDAGKQVAIAWVYRDPKDALVNGALKRAERQRAEFGTGRTVPIAEHAKTHEGVAPTIRALMDEFGNNPNVTFSGIDNSRGKGASKIDTVDNLINKAQNNRVSVADLQKVLDEEFKAGRISEQTYKGFSGKSTEDAAIRPRQSPSTSDVEGGKRQDKRAKVTPDTTTQAADDALSRRPDLTLKIGEDADGNPITIKARDFLDEARQAAKDADADVGLFKIAASCLLGGF